MTTIASASSAVASAAAYTHRRTRCTRNSSRLPSPRRTTRKRSQPNARFRTRSPHSKRCSTKWFGDRRHLISSPPFEHHQAVMTAAPPASTSSARSRSAFDWRCRGMTAAVERPASQNAIAFGIPLRLRAASAQRTDRQRSHAQAAANRSDRFGSEMRADNTRPPSSWWYDKTKGGGLANAFMPHIVDLALWLGGRPAQSSCGFLRTAIPRALRPTAKRTLATSPTLLRPRRLGDGLAARMTVDGTMSIDHRRSPSTPKAARPWPAAQPDGPQPLRRRGRRLSEYELKPLKYAKYANVFYSIPHFMGPTRRLRHPHRNRRRHLPNFADA